MIIVLPQNPDVEQQATRVHLQPQTPCAVWCHWFVVERRQDPPKILQYFRLREIATLSRAANVNGILQQKAVCLFTGGVVQDAGGIIDLGQQAFCSVEMVRNRRVCRLCCQWPVTIDSNIASDIAGMTDVQSKCR